MSEQINQCYICEPGKYEMKPGAIVPYCKEHFPTQPKEEQNTCREEIPEWEKEFNRLFTYLGEGKGWDEFVSTGEVKEFIRTEIASAEKRGYEIGWASGANTSYETGLPAYKEGRQSAFSQVRELLENKCVPGSNPALFSDGYRKALADITYSITRII